MRLALLALVDTGDETAAKTERNVGAFGIQRVEVVTRVLVVRPVEDDLVLLHQRQHLLLDLGRAKVGLFEQLELFFARAVGGGGGQRQVGARRGRRGRGG